MNWPENCNFYKDLGVRLKYSREKKYGKSRGTKKQCATDLGMSDQMWGDIESGRVKLNPEKIIFLAEFFDVDHGWLLTGEAKQKSAPAPSENRPAQANLFVRFLSLMAEYDVLIREAGGDYIPAWNHILKEQVEEMEEKVCALSEALAKHKTASA